MKLAYADPPYIGCAKRHYSDDPRCAEVDHSELIARLVRDYDGWALSCHSPSLRTLLPMCPESARVAAWCKPWAVFRPGVSPAFAWEPVIFMPSRRGDRGEDTARDWIVANPIMPNDRYARGTKGAKRPEFCFWLFDLLRADPGDSFDDLYPGSGIVTDCWNAFCKRPIQEGLFAGEPGC